MDVVKADCVYYHPAHDCNRAHIENINRISNIVGKNFLITHLINALHSRSQPLSILKILRILLSAILRTELFYGCSTFLYSVLRCRLRTILGYHSRPALLLAGFIASAIGSIFEGDVQLSNQLLIQGKDVLVIIAKLAASRNLLPKLTESYAYTWSFSFALAILNYYYTTDPEMCPSVINIIMDKLVGDERDKNTIEEYIRVILESFGLNFNRHPSDKWTVKDVIIGIGKNTFFGYLIGIVLGIFTTPQWKVPVVFQSAKRGGSHTAIFLGSLIGIYRGLSILLRPLNKSISSIIIGFTSAWSMILWNYKLGSVLSLSYAISTLLNDLVKRGLLPKVSFSYNLIYGLIGGISIYAIQFENLTVPESTKEFFAALAGTDPQVISEKYKDITKAYNLPIG